MSFFSLCSGDLVIVHSAYMKNTTQYLGTVVKASKYLISVEYASKTLRSKVARRVFRKRDGLGVGEYASTGSTAPVWRHWITPRTET